MTPFALSLLTPASAEPVTLAEAKDHLRVSWAEDDAAITRAVADSRAAAERECGRQFVSATWRLLLDDFPRGPDAAIRLPMPPCQSVTAVRYYDAAGVLTTVPGGDYHAATAGEPARVVPKAGAWPAVELGRPEAVQVDFVAGYGTAAQVPADLKGALLLILGDRWANRGDTQQVGIGTDDRPIPPAARRVLTAYRGHSL